MTDMKSKHFLALSFLLLCLSAHAQEAKPALSFATAQKILQGCLAYADSAKLKLTIVLYNADAQMVSFARMDGASLGSSKIAQWKGISAATYGASTAETGSWNVSNAPDIATIPGGLPIKLQDGKLIGGLGVSGAAASVDVLCAEAGLKAAGLYQAPKK